MAACPSAVLVRSALDSSISSHAIQFQGTKTDHKFSIPFLPLPPPSRITIVHLFLHPHDFHSNTRSHTRILRPPPVSGHPTSGMGLTFSLPPYLRRAGRPSIIPRQSIPLHVAEACLRLLQPPDSDAPEPDHEHLHKPPERCPRCFTLRP